jgi:lipopolysaccharide export system protein LptA
MEQKNVNVTHQNNVAIRRPTPIQSTNITYKRNLTKPQKPSLSTNANPTEDAEKEINKNCNESVYLLGWTVM